MARVLVVDDDPAIVHLLELNLELEGHESFSVTDGRDVVDRIREVHPDVVLLDIMLPHVDGWQLCEQVRSDPDLAGTPIVLLTARAQAADIQHGEEVGADAYVTKPFDPMEVIGWVERLAAGRP